MIEWRFKFRSRDPFLILVFCFSFNALALNETLRLRLEQWPTKSITATPAENVFSISNCQISDPVNTKKQIERWLYEPIWTSSQGSLNATGEMLLSYLNSAVDLGLNPQDYHVDCIASLLDESVKRNQDLQNDLEILLTDAFIQYISHNKNGRLNPLVIHPDWFMKGKVKPHYEPYDYLFNITNIENILLSSEADFPEYKALKSEYKKLSYRANKDPKIKTILKPRMIHSEVALLVSQLKSLGFIIHQAETTEYSASIESAVKLFQTSVKLEGDGIVGPDTVKALEDAIHGNSDAIKVNLERLRWLPQQYGSRYILVDIAGFQLQYWDENKARLTMRVIVGKNYRQTPIFHQLMRYVVINPSWIPTYTIATQDLIPKIKSNPNYFKETGMKVFKGWGETQEQLDPNSIKWQEINQKKFPYRFSQPPGPENPLGRVKFIFPNEFDVYMHDTNNPSLFLKQELTFSSGCIRLEKPKELLYMLFEKSKKWPTQRLENILNRNQEITIPLEQTLPVYLLYKTAFLNENGRVSYRKDIYQRDGIVLKALQNSAPRINSKPL